MVETTEKSIDLEESLSDIQIAEIEREPSPVAYEEKTSIKATPRAAAVDPTVAPRPAVQEFLASEPEAPKTDELEALWPGVHQEFMPPIQVKKTPSFYIMMGFIGGAILSLMMVWGYSTVSQKVALNESAQDKPILIANNETQNADTSVPMTTKNVDPTAPLEPICKSYEVKSGDTLVSIALKNYRKVTPRLIDTIVEQNNLKNANVLNMGQKLTLPTYQPQNSRLAGTEAGQVH